MTKGIYTHRVNTIGGLSVVRRHFLLGLSQGVAALAVPIMGLALELSYYNFVTKVF